MSGGNATARVTVTFELAYEVGSWGDDCSIEQLRKQAEEGAKGAASQIIEAAHRGGRNGAVFDLRLKSIGDTTAILLPERK